jgi:peptidyl-prolyl cis-trans isomerase SurA
MKSTGRTLVLAVLAVLAVTAAAGPVGTANASVVVDRVVAVVNDDIITLSDLQRELAREKNVTDERLLLEAMIDRKLQLAAAKRDGMDVSDRELSDALADIMKRNNMDQKSFEQALAKEGLTYEQYRTELREQMTLSRLFNKHVRSGIAVDEAEVRTYYEKNLHQFTLPEEVRVRHLVVSMPAGATDEQVEATRQKAEALMARLRNGEDFIKLIRERSDSPSANQDGDLGFLQRGVALPEIDAATKDLKPGEYAGPVRTADGFQILRVEEVRTPVRPYEKVKDEITKLLYDQKMDNTYREWLQTLRSDSHIENRL